MSTELTTVSGSILAVSKQAETLMPTLTTLALANMPKGTTQDDAQRVVIRELNNLESILNQKPELAQCSTGSKIQALRDCINNNLSLAPSAKLVYLLPSKRKIAVNAPNEPVREIEEWVVSYEPTANGELSIARQAKRIFDYKHSIVYDDNGNVQSVTIWYLVPTIGGSRWSDPYMFLKPHFQKWKNASAKKNKGNANPNYTSWNQDDKFQNGTIDPDFALTKAIKHSLKRLGTNMNEVNDFMPTAVLNTPAIVEHKTTTLIEHKAPVELKTPIEPTPSVNDTGITADPSAM